LRKTTVLQRKKRFVLTGTKYFFPVVVHARTRTENLGSLKQRFLMAKRNFVVPKG
jgi:hypothetical protein